MQLSSIPGLENVVEPANNNSSNTASSKSAEPSADTVDKPSDERPAGAVSASEDKSNNNTDSVPLPATTTDIGPSGVKVSEDVRFKKYFKMLQFGVPAPAVKLKMEADGVEARFLE